MDSGPACSFLKSVSPQLFRRRRSPCARAPSAFRCRIPRSMSPASWRTRGRPPAPGPSRGAVGSRWSCSPRAPTVAPRCFWLPTASHRLAGRSDPHRGETFELVSRGCKEAGIGDCPGFLGGRGAAMAAGWGDVPKCQTPVRIHEAACAAPAGAARRKGWGPAYVCLRPGSDRAARRGRPSRRTIPAGGPNPEAPCRNHRIFAVTTASCRSTCRSTITRSRTDRPATVT